MSLMSLNPAAAQMWVIRILATIVLAVLIFAGGYCKGRADVNSEIAKENVKVEAVRADNAEDAGRTLAEVQVEQARADAAAGQVDDVIEQMYPDPPMQADPVNPAAQLQPVPLPEICREAIPVYGCSCGPVLDDLELRLFNWGNAGSEVERPFNP